MTKRPAKLLLGVVLALASLAAPAVEPIRIGWTDWSDAEFITRLTARLIEQRMGRQVSLVQTDIKPVYRALASGDLHLMLMSWRPATHRDYMERVGDEVFSLGILYGYARLGWVVPDYVPRSTLSTIADLTKAEVREKLDGTIIGVDRGAGLTRRSERVIDAYGLEAYELRLSSDAGMTAALEQAMAAGEWVVVTGWSPHWKFSAYDLRYLEDPLGVLGGYERVHAMAHKGFYQSNPEVALMVSRMFIPIDKLQAALNHARQTSYDKAVARFIEDNADLVDYWVSGRL